jgi:methylmalonyl-CoA carboxyltransferase small subunit
MCLRRPSTLRYTSGRLEGRKRVKLRISLEGQSYDVEVEVLPEHSADPLDFEPRIDLPASLRRPAPPSDVRPGDKICRSPITGVVVSVAASSGRKVRQDDPVAVIEAMKMLTTIGAPVDGTVDAVHVVPGQQVKSGQPLCTLV